MEWFFYTSFTSRPLSEAIGISGVKGVKMNASYLMVTSKKQISTCMWTHTHTQCQKTQAHSDAGTVIYSETSWATVMGC